MTPNQVALQEVLAQQQQMVVTSNQSMALPQQQTRSRTKQVNIRKISMLVDFERNFRKILSQPAARLVEDHRARYKMLEQSCQSKIGELKTDEYQTFTTVIDGNEFVSEQSQRKTLEDGEKCTKAVADWLKNSYNPTPNPEVNKVMNLLCDRVGQLCTNEMRSKPWPSERDGEQKQERSINKSDVISAGTNKFIFFVFGTYTWSEGTRRKNLSEFYHYLKLEGNITIQVIQFEKQVLLECEANLQNAIENGVTNVMDLAKRFTTNDDEGSTNTTTFFNWSIHKKAHNSNVMPPSTFASLNSLPSAADANSVQPYDSNNHSPPTLFPNNNPSTFAYANNVQPQVSNPHSLQTVTNNNFPDPSH